MEGKERDCVLDYIRIIAISFVVFIHSFGLLSSAKHLWYLNLLAVIYLSLPFLSYLNSLETRMVLLLFAGTLLLCVSQNFNGINIYNGYIYAYLQPPI